MFPGTTPRFVADVFMLGNCSHIPDVLYCTMYTPKGWATVSAIADSRLSFFSCPGQTPNLETRLPSTSSWRGTSRTLTHVGRLVFLPCLVLFHVINRLDFAIRIYDLGGAHVDMSCLASLGPGLPTSPELRGAALLLPSPASMSLPLHLP